MPAVVAEGVPGVIGVVEALMVLSKIVRSVVTSAVWQPVPYCSAHS